MAATPTADWIYHADQHGRQIEGPTSIYTDCFVIYGLSEYYRAVHDEQLLSIARETLERVCRRVDEPDFQETAPYPLPLGWKNHGIPMILTETMNEMILTTGGDPRMEAQLDDYVARIMNHFVRPDKNVLLEFLTTDYQELPPPAGTFVMPGHAIESMWFVLHVARRRGDQALIRRAAEVIRWHLELGWDPEFGGILSVAGYRRSPTLSSAFRKKTLVAARGSALCDTTRAPTHWRTMVPGMVSASGGLGLVALSNSRGRRLAAATHARRHAYH